MVNINKELYKKFINETRSDKYRITIIHDIRTINKRYLYESISGDSKYREIAKVNGYVDILMVNPIWDGWKITYNDRKDYFTYSENRKTTYIAYDIFIKWKRHHNLKELIE